MSSYHTEEAGLLGQNVPSVPSALGRGKLGRKVRATRTRCHTLSHTSQHCLTPPRTYPLSLSPR